MNFYEFPMPTAVDGDTLKAHIGCDELYVRDDVLVMGSDTLTLDQVTAGLATYVYSAPVDPIAAIKASGITHALSLGFTQAQAEAMFP